jgi:hypothetical protein
MKTRENSINQESGKFGCKRRNVHNSRKKNLCTPKEKEKKERSKLSYWNVLGSQGESGLMKILK